MRKLCLILIIILLSFSTSYAEKFVLAIIPDTQNEVVFEGAPFALFNRMDWLIRNRNALNLKLIGHVGDLVNWDTDDHIQWLHASNAFAFLDSYSIPYAIAIGNHDTAATTLGGSAAPGDAHLNLRNTRTFNMFFPIERFTNLQGLYENKKADNAYHIFKAGGLNWLVINLEFEPRPGVVEWANLVVKSHPNFNVIILTHNYLNRDANYSKPSGYGDLSSEKLKNLLIDIHKNIKLVFCGHTGGVARRKDVGINGNSIYVMLFDMSYEPTKGWTRLVEIDTNQRTISVKTFSPHLNQSLIDNANQFIFFGVDFIASNLTTEGNN